MADPKFANLPFIAHDQPDVYETQTVEAETSDFYEEETENESIERLHISTKDSYNKFKGKYLTGNVDFSDRLGKKIRTGYDSRSEEYELAGEGEKETPMQKCRRLQCEMHELITEVAAMQSEQTTSKEEKESYEAISNVVGASKKLLESLRLEQVLGKETTAKNADADVKNLLKEVEAYKSTRTNSSAPIRTITENDLARSTRIAELEYRLHELESVVGAKPEKMSRLASSLGTTNLLEAVQQISTKAALLQPSQLEVIEGRLTNIANKMDAINEKASGTSQDSAREQKISELYEMAKSAEPVVPILPDILQRMQALESLHKYATNFSKLFAELETTQANILNGVSNNKALLDGVQEAFAINLVSINDQVKNLEERVKKLSIPKK
uniref:CSON007183 protein n=1 Tax=Culicoides sonorensis TaxID=179676 RepID=A0A336MXZ2_CULSO